MSLYAARLRIITIRSQKCVGLICTIFFSVLKISKIVKNSNNLDPATNMSILFNEIKVQGIIVPTFVKDWPGAFVEMKTYLDDVSLLIIWI